MDMNRLTQKVSEAVASAQTLATRLSHQEVDGEHLLAELLAQSDGLAPDRQSTRLNSSHITISYAVSCLN